MANKQLEAFGEIFDSEASRLRFRESDYSCPFDSRIVTCDKPNRGPLKYGNCSAQVGTQKRIICPRRFYENNFNILKDIKEFIWSNNSIVDCYDELRINKTSPEGDSFNYGNLDWILVNRDNYSDFCGIEIQTDSTTGTGAFATAINDLLSGAILPSYGFGLNTLSSFKGFLPQFIFKGQLFDDWKKPYCAVVQDELWEKFIKKFRIRFKEISTYTTETFLFFVYSLNISEQDSKYHLGNYKVYATRWIDLLFSFSVENDLLVDLNEIKNKIERKIISETPKLSL